MRGISIEFSFNGECSCHDCLQPVHLCVKVIRDDDDDDDVLFCFVCLSFFFSFGGFYYFVEPPVKILFFLQAHPIVKRLLKRSRAIVIAKKKIPNRSTF